MTLFQILLFIHAMTAIVAFGPTFALSLSAGLAEKEPQHLSFNNRARALISSKRTVPGAVIMGLSGGGLIAVTGVPWLEPGWRWLQISIALYLGAILYTVLRTWRLQRELAEANARLAAGRARAEEARKEASSGAGPSPAGAPAGSPAGPPPELAHLIHRIRRDGKAMGVVIVVIVFLMVAKPVFPF